MTLTPDIGVYDTFSYTEREERRNQISKAEMIACKFLQPVEFNPLKEKITFLNQLQKLKSNWDGYGAKAPNQNTIDNAIGFLSGLPSTYQKMLNIDEVSISTYGTVIMEWYKDEDSFISIEVGSSKIGFLSETPDRSNPYSESIEMTSNAVAKEIIPVFTKVFKGR